MKKTIYLLTGNERKIQSFKKAIGGYDIDMDIKKIWLPEVQSKDVVEIANFAAKYGANKLNLPVIKVDVGFYINGLNGFPGAFVHYVNEQVGADIFSKILKDLDDKSAYTKTAVAYCEPGKEPVYFSSMMKGNIVYSLPKGEGSFIDRLFIPNHNKNPNKITLGELRKNDYDTMLEMWGDAEVQFAKWFDSRPEI